MGLQHYGNKVEYDGFTFDSTKEFNFYKRFLENSGYSIGVHDKFKLLEKNVIDEKISIRGITYKPDFIVRDKDGLIKHVYDVKNGFTDYAIDRSANISFKLFAKVYKIPVEVVVIRAHDFKTKIMGTTKKYEIQYHDDVNYDWRENEQCIVNSREN